MQLAFPMGDRSGTAGGAKFTQCQLEPKESPDRSVVAWDRRRSLPIPLVGSMDRYVRSWCVKSVPCLPIPSQKPPSGSAWVHEIKHDGYRLIARRDGNRVRLYTRRGYDWSGKYPRIVESLLSLRVRSIIVDGGAVWAGNDGKSDFDQLHSGAHDDAVVLYAFDLLELNSEDYRQHPLAQRKAKLEKILARTQGMRFFRTLGRGWRDDFPARLQNGIGRYRFETTGFPVSQWSMQELGQDRESKFASRAPNPGWELVT